MAVEAKRPDYGGGEEVSPAKKLLLFGLIVVAGYLLYQAFWADDAVANSSIPRAMQVTYVPSDFKMNLNDAKTLEILSNPQRYKTEFDQLILDFNSNLVVHVCNRMGLSAGLKSAAIGEYRKMHPYIRQMYFNDFVGLKDTTNQLYEAWYENETVSAVDLLNQVASKYTCFFIQNIIATVLRTQDGKLAVKGSKVETPCGIALTEGVRPMVEQLQKTAAVRDFSRAHNMMKERVERAITELAVMEVKDKKGVKISNASKLLGYNVSTTEVEVIAMSVMKVGFDLNNYFKVDVDSRSRTVNVTLPQPRILSHEVYPKIENMDIGIMRDLSSEDFNGAFNNLRRAFVEDAQRSDIFEKSKKRANDVMSMMLQPMVRNIDKGYKVAVRFQNPQSLDYDLPADNQPVKQPQIRQQPQQNTRQPQRMDGKQ
jgi:Protein of unknown function (DUF4230)